jgi:hypothetical protein
MKKSSLIHPGTATVTNEICGKPSANSNLYFFHLMTAIGEMKRPTVLGQTRMVTHVGVYSLISLANTVSVGLLLS